MKALIDGSWKIVVKGTEIPHEYAKDLGEVLITGRNEEKLPKAGAQATWADKVSKDHVPGDQTLVDACPWAKYPRTG